MDWYKIVNFTTDYIEKNLTSKIDLKSIADQCHVSYFYFQKMFSVITGYTLKEYIRNRRLTLASYDVSKTDERILDIALKYQYSSNEAFTRAFSKLHGMNPGEARRNGETEFYHFPILKYNYNDEEVKNIKFEKVGPIKIKLIGRTIRINKSAFMEKREILDDFRDEFLSEMGFNNLYTTPGVFYKVKFNIDPIERTFDVFYGFDVNEYNPNIEDSEFLDIEYPTFLKYKYVGDTVKSIRAMKTVVVDEWNQNDYSFDPQFEIEYATLNQEHRLDIVYMVSIHDE